MLKKTITYTDFNGDVTSEDFYFHLSKAELVELEMSHEGGLSSWIQNVIANNDGKTIMTEFKNIILSSYGQRSADGRRFVKNQALREEFESTEAYSELFIELVTNAESGAEFVQGIIPKDLAEEAAKIADEAPALEAVPNTPEVKEAETVTRVQMAMMSSEDLEKISPRIASGEVKIVER